MDLTEYRAGEKEQTRIGDLFSHVPAKPSPAPRSALDIGARDGYLSLRLAERFEAVTALDLTLPHIEHPAVSCVEGNAANLPFDDKSFDLVLCAEVLEHVPPAILQKACAEIVRVTKGHALIGVPYMQDTRVGRLTCRACGGKNPPWAHVNEFDEARLRALFKGLTAEKISFVGRGGTRTNPVSAALMDFAGNPYGTYDQEEPCIHCGKPFAAPPPRSLVQKVATKAAHVLNRLQAPWVPKRGNWIHVLFRKA